MGAIGERFQQTFVSRMAQIGTTATLSRLTTAAYDTATSEASISAESLTVKGVFDSAQNNKHEGEQTDVRSKERIFLIPSLKTDLTALGYEPAVGDSVLIGLDNFSIRLAEPEFADDVIVYHRLYLERG